MYFNITLIPSSYHNLKNICKEIIPKNEVNYWEIGNCQLNMIKYNVIFCSDTLVNLEKIKCSTNNSFASNYYNSFLSRFYIIYKTNEDEFKYIQNVEEIPNFIGKIDNLAEALFLTSFYGYAFFDGKKYGSYSIRDNKYYLNLYKINTAPDNPPDRIVNKKGKESNLKLEPARIVVDKDGNVYQILRNNTQKKLNNEDMYRKL